MGPPSDPPNRLCTSGATGTPSRLLNQSLALPRVLRYHSNIAPCQLFVPVLMTRLIWAPDERPSFALELIVSTRNSWIASAFHLSTAQSIALLCASLIS